MKELISTHFSAVLGYGLWLILIFFLALTVRFDNLVTHMAAGWMASVATYINAKAIAIAGQAPPNIAVHMPAPADPQPVNVTVVQPEPERPAASAPNPAAAAPELSQWVTK